MNGSQLVAYEANMPEALILRTNNPLEAIESLDLFDAQECIYVKLNSGFQATDEVLTFLTSLGEAIRSNRTKNFNYCFHGLSSLSCCVG